MEIGHNVMHGQWACMNDQNIHSSSWDWDTASTKEAWKHSHNYIHHTYTNIRGKDKDLGYEIMRIDPHQKWHPVYLLQPLYNLALMAFFEWGVAVHDLDIEAIRSGEKSQKQVLSELKGIWGKARQRGRRGCPGGPPPELPPGATAQKDARRRRPRPPARTRTRTRGPRERRSRRVRGRRQVVQVDPLGELHGEHRPQRVGPRDHLLRPLP